MKVSEHARLYDAAIDCANRHVGNADVKELQLMFERQPERKHNLARQLENERGLLKRAQAICDGLKFFLLADSDENRISRLRR